MEGLKLFLENWKQEVRNYYLDLANQLINREKTHKELKDNLTIKDYDKVCSLVYTIRFEDGKDIDKILNFINKEAEKKELDFANKITKYVGNIIDCKGLRTSINYGIDGIVIGENGKVKVETIIAGGYNIQRLHFRILVKKIK